VFEFDREAPIMRRPGPVGAFAPWGGCRGAGFVEIQPCVVGAVFKAVKYA
jgi:hypothetical protein